MKKTFKLILALMLVLFVFVSCENKPEETIKTAKDFLAGKSIATSLKFNLEDLELDEEDAEELTAMYFTFPVAFDKDGNIYTTNAELVDFVSTVDGMTYKTSFTQKIELEPMVLIIDEEEEVEEEYDPNRTFELEFKVLNENKVVISGSMASEEITARFVETEATLSGNLPNWFTSGDWLFIPDEEQDVPMGFTIINESILIDSMPFGEITPYSFNAALTSKNDVVQVISIQAGELYGSKMRMETTMAFEKKTADEAKVNVETLMSYSESDGVIEEGEFTKFESTAKRLASLPKWAQGFDGLKNSDYDFIPLSNEAIRNQFDYLEVIDFNREVDDNSIVLTILTAYDPNYGYDYDYYKTVIIINKTPVKDQFYCLYNYYSGYEYGSEYLEWSADDNIFTPSEYVSWE